MAKKRKFIHLFKSPEFYLLVKRIYYFFIFVIVFFSFFHVGYANRIIPGVKIGDVFVGGMTYDEAHSAMEKYLDGVDARISLTYEGLEYEILGENIKLVYDVEGSVSRAFELGRTGNVFIDTKDKLASLVKTIRIKSHYDCESDVLDNKFSQIKGEINQAALEPKFYIDSSGSLSISDPLDGKKVIDQDLYELVISSFDLVSFGLKEIPVKTIKPELTVKDLEDVFEEVTKIIDTPLVITQEEKEWEVTPEQKLSFLSVEKNIIGGTKLSFNRANFDAFAELFSQNVNKLPKGTVTSVEDGVVTGFELIQGGEEIDMREFVSDFEQSLFGDENEVKVITNPIDSFGDPSKYGIFTLLGEGKSTYIGSARERVHNLTLAASRTNGVLVPPDGIYSFNNSVGAISAETGYDTAYIIASGKTVLGEGGGVCQTSTTLFRAMLNSGLPIVTRHPHAYRVSYYEQDQPVGFDASIYQPSLDLQFKNDTPNYVLVQSEWNTYAQTLSFKIYGTPDGRKVEITEPVVANIKPPPEPLYQDDPSLPKGEVKQIDFEAWGATSKFSRTVTKGEDILHQDVFSSTYQPWRAVYLVGIGS